MGLNDQYNMSRIPLKPLPYKNRELAQNSEFMIDYVSEDPSKSPSYHLYIVDAHDATKIIDLTNVMIKEAFGNDITITIEGMEEPLSLHDLLNFIYKRFLYPDNLHGFNYDEDYDKVYAPGTKVILMRNADGSYFLPITTADAVFDKNGVNIQKRLDNITRLGFANDYIKVSQENQNVFEITYPFVNYPLYGNYLELRIGTTFIDKTRYSLVDNRNEDGDVIGATITFFNETFEFGRRIDILYIYNAVGNADGEHAAVYGGQIANNTISTAKFEKISDLYTINDPTSVASSAAMYAMYKDFSEAINMNAGSSFFLLDSSSSRDTIDVNIATYNVFLSAKYIMLNIYVQNPKNENITITVRHGDQTQENTMQYTIHMEGGIAAGRVLKLVLNQASIKPLTLIEDMLTQTRYIYTCIDGETEIPFKDLSYNTGSIIRVYRNGVRLFEDLDYSMNKTTEIVTLFTRAEEGERIVFEAMSI